MVVFPNAKINIGLNITEKRSDGFHNIESIFYPIVDLYDVLEIVKSDQLEFTSTGIDIPGDAQNNLCLKAYDLLKQDFNIAPVHIYLLKAIPIGAGLGGGSADAAFTLKSLNQLFKLDLSDNELITYAQKLGSDCAFFIKNQPVYAFNKGDEFKLVEMDLSLYKIQVEYPNIHIGTSEAYAGVSPQESKENLLDLIKKPISNWKDVIKNDFESSIFPNHKSIQELKEKMYNDGAVYASMTGSGSAVFGIFKKTI